MHVINHAIGEYQQMIGVYDKQPWERSVERAVSQSLHNLARKRAKVNRELIDVDLVRGSTFSKIKPRHSWLSVSWKAFLRVLFLPFYYRWWINCCGRISYALFMIMFILQASAFVIYFTDDLTPCDEALSLSHLLTPCLMLLVLAIVHTQITSSSSACDPSTTSSASPQSTAAQNNCSCNLDERFNLLEDEIESFEDEGEEPVKENVDPGCQSFQSPSFQGSSLSSAAHCLSSSYAGTGSSHFKEVKNAATSDHRNRENSLSNWVSNNQKKTYKQRSKFGKIPTGSRRSGKTLCEDTDNFRDIPSRDKPGSTYSGKSDRSTICGSEDCLRILNKNSHLGHSHGEDEEDDEEEDDSYALTSLLVPPSNSDMRRSRNYQGSGKGDGQDTNSTTSSLNTEDDDDDDEDDDVAVEDVIIVQEDVTANKRPSVIVNDISNKIAANGKVESPSRSKCRPTNCISVKNNAVKNNACISLSQCSAEKTLQKNNCTSDSSSQNFNNSLSSDGYVLRKRHVAQDVQSSNVQDVPEYSSSKQKLNVDEFKNPSCLGGRSYSASHLTNGNVLLSNGSPEHTKFKESPSNISDHKFIKSVKVEKSSSCCSLVECGISSNEKLHSEDDGLTMAPFELLSEYTDDEIRSCIPNDGRGRMSRDVESDSAVPADLVRSHSAKSSTSNKISCIIWDGGELQKVNLTVLDIGWNIMKKVEKSCLSYDYLLLGVFFSFILASTPIVFRIYHSWSELEGLRVFDNVTDFNRALKVAMGHNWRQVAIISNGLIQRLSLSCLLFFMLAVSERTFYQRLLYAKNFCYLTSLRRARKYQLPHFRLNKVRNIKSWLSIRSFLKRRGPQRSVEIIVSTAFLAAVVIISTICIELLQDYGSFLDELGNWELVVWGLSIGVFLLRFITLGTNINKKYRNFSVLITEQINLYLHMEQKPHKKNELMMANSVLKLAEDLLKEVESPFKVSGLSANPLLYNITKVVVLSAFSAVLTELLGFKLKLYKIKIRA